MNGNLRPFERAALDLPTIEEMRLQYPDASPEQLQAARDQLAGHEVWLNNAYQVNIDKAPRHGFPGTRLWHLSIKRLDKRAVHDWRDLQAIKNMLVGPQYEAVELYPSRDRTVDQANQYHLWVFMAQAGRDAPQLPFGWTDRSVLDVADRADNSRQRGLHQGGVTI